MWESAPELVASDSFLQTSGDRKKQIQSKILTAHQLCERTPPRVEWLLHGYVGRGFLTELDGKAKDGKSTFLMDCVAHVVAGKPFIGLETTKCRVLYLTEESEQTFRLLLERAGLTKCNEVFVLNWTNVREYTWEDTVAAVVELAIELGVAWIVVDTLPQWSAFAAIRRTMRVTR